jgi:hypothetical protein
MKISGVGPQGVPEGAAPAERTEGARPEETFAERLARGVSSSTSTADASRAAASADQPAAVGPLATIVADWQAGKIDGRAAVDKVVETILAAHVAPTASDEVRDQVRSALRQALEEDPGLARKLRTVGR